MKCTTFVSVVDDLRSRKQNILIELPPFQYISYFSTHLISQVHSKPKKTNIWYVLKITKL